MTCPPRELLSPSICWMLQWNFFWHISGSTFCKSVSITFGISAEICQNLLGSYFVFMPVVTEAGGYIQMGDWLGSALARPKS